MRPNRLREMWKNDTPAFVGWCNMPGAFSAELMAQQGFDAITVDMQHGLMGYDVAVSMLQAISTTDAVPIVRASWNDPVSIMRALDAGAYGIICPMVNNREECERFVGTCKYPPEGFRSAGPVRAVVYGGKEYVQYANTTILTMAMIETAEAYSKLDEILSVPGLDAIYVGPNDLSISMGGEQRMDYTNYQVEWLETILAACKRHNIIPGIHTGSPEYSERAAQMGFRFIAVQSDVAFLTSMASQALKIARGEKETVATEKKIY